MATTDYSSKPEEEEPGVPGAEPKGSDNVDSVRYWQGPLTSLGSSSRNERELGLHGDEPEGSNIDDTRFYGQGPVAPTYSAIRELPLLDGEKIEEQFVPEGGLVSDTPWKGQVLVLTNRRIISFVQTDGHNEISLASLGELKGVSVKANSRGVRDLVQGLGLVLIGVLAYFILGYVLDGVTIALALGAAIIFVGMLFVVKYLFWEEEGSITFQVGSWALSFPYKNNRASADVYKLVNRFFQLKP